MKRVLQRVPRFLWPLVNTLQAALLVSWTTFWIVGALAVRLVSRDASTALAMARRCWAPALLWGGGMELQVDGLDNVDWTRPHYFAANHQSLVDVLALFRALPVPLLFILKEELGRVPFLGWYASAMGMIFLPRDNPRQSLKNLRRCNQRIADGFSILMFPEGTRSRDQRIGPFKPGIFLPAIDGQIPIVPVVLAGTGQILPRDGFHVRPGTIRVTIGRPVTTMGLTRHDRLTLAEEIRTKILTLRADGVGRIRTSEK